MAQFIPNVRFTSFRSCSSRAASSLSHHGPIADAAAIAGARIASAVPYDPDAALMGAVTELS
jgi:hypothetical protein